MSKPTASSENTPLTDVCSKLKAAGGPSTTEGAGVLALGAAASFGEEASATVGGTVLGCAACTKNGLGGAIGSITRGAARTTGAGASSGGSTANSNPATIASFRAQNVYNVVI